ISTPRSRSCRARCSSAPIIRARSTSSAWPTRGAATRPTPSRRSSARRRRGDDDAAVDAYRAALDAGIGDSGMRAEIYRGLGSVYLRQRRYDKAVRELRKAVAATPDDAETQGLLGRALYLKGDYDTARVCLE